MLNITNSQKLRAVDCRFRRVKKVSNCNQAAQRFYNLLDISKHFLHDTQGVADSSSATPTILKAVGLMTCGFLFSTVSMLKNFGTFPKHLEKMRKSVGLNPKICDKFAICNNMLKEMQI